MSLWRGIFKSNILGAERMCYTVHDIQNCKAKSVFIDAHNTGINIESALSPKDTVIFGMCEMIGELQQEVATLKSQLNTIGKNI